MPEPRPVTPLGIAADLLVSVEHDLAGLGGIDPVVRSRLSRALALVAGLDPYVAASTSPASPALAALEERTRGEDWASRSTQALGGLEQEMLSGHVEGRFLAFLVHATRAQRVLEIGMFTGYSALAMAEALPADGLLVACEIDRATAALARECLDASPAGQRVEVAVGPAADTLSRLAAAGECFDLVFVDADKGGYAGYLEALLDDGLLADGGVICVDNTLLQGEPWVGEPGVSGAAVADFNQQVAADPRLEQVLVPLRDGVTLIWRA